MDFSFIIKRLCLLACVASAGLVVAQRVDDAVVARGRELFTQQAQPACAVCHSLQEAGAQGTVGPSLDEMKPEAPRVLKAIRNGVGGMPAYDSQSLTDEDAQAIARYVEHASRARE